MTNSTIFLIGFMGVGKTSLGKKLAHRLDTKLIDIDLEIEKQEAKTISQIFKDTNEYYFRNVESSILKSLDLKNKVISSGGGLPCFNDNLLYMKSKGVVIYLDTNINFIISRLKENNSRPLIQNKSKEEIIALKNSRELYYQQAHLRVDSYNAIEETFSFLNKQLP